MSDHNRHLSAERIQAFLEGGLPDRERTLVEEHARSCARCDADLEAWQLVFAELSGLPRFEPPLGFAQRVLEGRTLRLPVGARIRQRLAAMVRPAAAAGHLAPERLQDLAEGLLRGRRLGRAEAHLAACGRCESELRSWQTLVEGLRALPPLLPSDGFGERVMARVRVRTLATIMRPAPSLPARLWSRARALAPTTRRGWAVASGVLAAPTAAVAALAAFVFSHPLLTPGHLLSYAWWQVSAFASATVSTVLGSLVDSEAVFRLYSAADFLAGSPLLVAALVSAFSVATLMAMWVLYRNLITFSSARRGYVHA